MRKLLIAILEDNKEVAQNLKEIINEHDDMECRQVYFNAEDAIIFLPNNPVDILIVDIGLPLASGIDAISKLKISCPDTIFTIFTVYDDDDKIFDSIKAGAKGYILKNDTILKIIDGLRELKNGGSPMSATIARRIIDHINNPKIPQGQSPLPLSKREIELLQLLSKGFLYKEIGFQLNITIGTVKQHIHKIYDKLNVSNRTEAINLYNDSSKI